MSDESKREVEAWVKGVREGLTAPDLIPRSEAEARIAEAVARERERCARIAKSFTPVYDGHRDHDRLDREDAISEVCDDIAAAIRQTEGEG